MNIKATYRYIQFRYEKEPIVYKVPCEIIRETNKSYFIKLLAPSVRGHRYGDCTWVNKDNVILPKQEIDTSDMWYQNL